MQVRVLGSHNLESLKSRHTCFLIDNVLAVDAGSIVSVLGFEEMSKIQAILLTHEHLDHSRDIPTLGLFILDLPGSIQIFALSRTLESVRKHLMNGDIYPDLTKSLNGETPKYQLRKVSPSSNFQVLDYEVKAIPTSHPVPSVGYIVKSKDGHSVAFTGDTGTDFLTFLKDPMAPKTLFVDVTFPNRLNDRARLTGHLTPGLLREGILNALRKGVSLPLIVPVHLSTQYENEVRQDLTIVEKELGISLTPAEEGIFTKAQPGD